MVLRLLVVSLVSLIAGSAHAFCRLTTEMPTPDSNCAATGIGLAWRRTCISFSMSQRLQPEPAFERIRDVADISFATWMQVQCERGEVGLEVRQTVELGECFEPEYNQRAPNANTILFVEDWAERDLPADAFGLTLVWHNPENGEIFDADMQINEDLGALTICGSACPARGGGEPPVDLQNVITHEAGHFFGLGHSSDVHATMSARASTGEISKRDLHEDDRAGLCSIYGDNPRPECMPSDFVPDNGFSPECFDDVEPGPRGGMCSVSAVGTRRAAPAGLLLLGLFLAGRLHRPRAKRPCSAPRLEQRPR